MALNNHNKLWDSYATVTVDSENSNSPEGSVFLKKLNL